MRESRDISRSVGEVRSDTAPHAHSPNAAIADSWRRCALDYSLDPTVRSAPIVLDAYTLAERLDQHCDLLQIASAEIDWLYEHIAQSGYALVLTDASGLVLYEKTDPGTCDTFHAAGLVVGADWSERREGTNGMGTCILANEPIIVHRDEHFRACHTGLTCFGSPIHDPAGSLVAVLDASTLRGQDGASDTHTMALVTLSARQIEKCLFLRHFQQERVLRFHTRAEFVNLQHDGALALARDATVIAADETAVRLLGAAKRCDLIGRRIDEIFEVRAEELLDRANSSPQLLQSVRDTLLGRRFYASVGHGRGGASASNTFSLPAEPLRVMQVTPATHRTARQTLEELAGEDPQMQRNVRSAHRIAMSRVPVMIQGPTGAGKELFARALHAASDRATQQFVAINCAAIPESLIESELFGYRSGAFTGARKEGMKGKILQSSGGTLFLDEIGDMPLPLQTRLLRVLEEQEVVPLGTETPLKVDLRVICASHQNLRAMISGGQFREDLYYRLNGITLELPPLAQRTDKERLIREFLAAETNDGRPAAIEMDAFRGLLDYDWPGNMRELRNVIRTALAICDGGVVRLRDLPSELRRGRELGATPIQAAAATAAPDTVAAREALLSTIRRCDDNMSRVAKLLCISRNTLYRRCKALGIRVGRRIADDDSSSSSSG
jgi:sigma-54 dependent transcriptional regulator, acetoin dehydrogenase operon transcriptional activator AcoR